MELTPQQITWLREKVKAAREAGVDDATIDAQLKQVAGVGLEEVLSFSLRDAGRSGLSGLTLGFNDEFAGGLAKLKGKDYTTARDEVRRNDAAAKYASPVATAVTEFAGGMAPALVGGAPMAAAKGAGFGARALRNAGTAGLFGAAAGAGHSEEEDAAGIAKDAAITGGLSAGIGGGMSLMGSGGAAIGRSIRDARNPQDAVLRASASQMPDDAAATVARQESLAPGTAVAADLSPGMAEQVSGVGADAAAGMGARKAAEARVEQLQQTLQKFGQQYQQINKKLTVDTDLRKILAEGADKGVKSAVKVLTPGAKEVDFATLHRFRSNLLADLRHVKDNSMKKHDKGELAEKITEWLSRHAPEITPLDKGYAFLNKALAAAENTLEKVSKSSSNYAKSSAYGAEAGSVGGSLPSTPRGVISDAMQRMFSPDRAARGRAVNETLLTPGNTKSSLQRMLEMQSLMGKPMSRAQRMLSGGLFGNVAPSTGRGLMQQ